MDKPSIVEIVGRRVELRRSGKEFFGLCPLHAEKTPSFTVNEEKAVFYCHGCHEGGDVFDFIQKLDGLTFPKACKALGIQSDIKSRPLLTPSRKRAAELAAAWVREQRARFNVLIAERLEERDLADEAGAFALADSIDRELVTLRAFYESLEHPRGAAELLAVRESIEVITNGVEILYDQPAPLPAWTPEYRAMLAKNPLDFEGVFK